MHRCRECPYESRWSFVLRHHMKKHRETRKPPRCTDRLEPYKCSDCDFESELRVPLLEHVDAQHRPNSIPTVKIEECRSGETRPSARLDSTYKCDNCEFETFSQLLFIVHIQGGCKSDLSRIKSRCWENYFGAGSVKDIPRDAGSFRCAKCPFKTKYRISLRRHFRNQHPPPGTVRWFRCDHCSYRAKKKDRLKIHLLNVHTPKGDMKWYRCGQCAYKTETKAKVKAHVSDNHVLSKRKRRLLKCSQCAYKTEYKSSLKSHVLCKHTAPDDVEWHRCKQCPYKAKMKSGLKRHVLYKHTSAKEIKWFDCAYCIYRAKMMHNLEKHILKQHASGTREWPHSPIGTATSAPEPRRARYF